LIENNRRPLPANLLIRLAQLFNVDVHSFATDEDARLVADLTEAFADPIFEEQDLTTVDVREMAAASPGAARPGLLLYRPSQTARSAADDLSSRLSDGEELAAPGAHLPSEEVTDLIQRCSNHFPELEAAAETMIARAKLTTDDLYPGLIRYLEKQLSTQVQIARWGSGRGVLRRFDPHRRLLVLSELLPTRSRTFQLAHQIAVLTQGPVMDRITADARLTTEESRGLARVTLANYFAGAVLMPYATFLQAAK